MVSKYIQPLPFPLDQSPVIITEENYVTTGAYHEIFIDASASYDETSIASFTWNVTRK